MRVPECEVCKKQREELKANPVGGCAKCEKATSGVLDPTCISCVQTSTSTNHFPLFKPKEEK